MDVQSDARGVAAVVPQKIVFRVDASLEIGTGHVMRCLTLASALRDVGAHCRFVSRQHAGNLIDRIREHGFQVHALPGGSGVLGRGAARNASGPQHAHWLGVDLAADAEQTRSAIGDTRCDWLIVDHYALDAKWESALRSICSNLMVIDDLADRPHDCDLLVDPGIDPDLTAKYRALAPKSCVLFLGPRYSMLRREFDLAKSNSAGHGPIQLPRKLVVLFGGDDASHSTLEALRAIRHTAPVGTLVDVIVSQANQDSEAIAAHCSQHPNCVMHFATDRVAALFASADLAIGSGGGATYERLYLRLPSILKAVAENQRGPLVHLKRAGLIEMYADDGQLVDRLRAAFQAGVKRPDDVVVNGVPAICQSITNCLVFLKQPTPFDVRRTFHWLQDDELRRMFLMATRPERRKHFQYWRAQLQPDAQRVFSIYLGNAHVGNAGIKDIDRAHSEAELWLYVGQADQKGKGIGRLALRQLEQFISGDLCFRKAVLHVSSDNVPAYNLYRKAGYVSCPAKDPSTLAFPTNRNVVRMEKTL